MGKTVKSTKFGHVSIRWDTFKVKHLNLKMTDSKKPPSIKRLAKFEDDSPESSSRTVKFNKRDHLARHFKNTLKSSSIRLLEERIKELIMLSSTVKELKIPGINGAVEFMALGME